MFEIEFLCAHLYTIGFPLRIMPMHLLKDPANSLESKKAINSFNQNPKQCVAFFKNLSGPPHLFYCFPTQLIGILKPRHRNYRRPFSGHVCVCACEREGPKKLLTVNDRCAHHSQGNSMLLAYPKIIEHTTHHLCDPGFQKLHIWFRNYQSK